MLPEKFIDRLKNIIPEKRLADCINSFAIPKPVGIRINTLRVKREEILKILEENGINYDSFLSFDNFILIQNGIELNLKKKQTTEGICLNDLLSKGLIYIQSPASFIVPNVLSPQPKEIVLDMCAAPGSKTCQMAELMNSDGRIIALENVKSRFFKLKSVVDLLGANIVEPIFTDGRRYRPAGVLFDRVLVDAPCSSEGRFKSEDKESFAYWSPRKIKEMQHKQKGLLLSAGRLVKAGGSLVYSTCTFAPEENECVVDWFLRKSKENFILAEIELPKEYRYDSLVEWQGKMLNKEVSKTLRILPGNVFESFFIAKFIRVK